MRIGGFSPFSLTDYAGHIAAIVFTQGCNFTCPYCHNKSLIPMHQNPSFHLEEADLFSFLEQRNNKLDSVVISGGEPTLQPDLLPFLKKIKDLNLLVKIYTNGTRPGVLKALIQKQLVDYVAMDIKAPFEIYSQLAGVKIKTGLVKESMEMIAKSGIPHEFRTTWFKPLLNETHIKRIRKMIPIGSVFKVQEPKEAQQDEYPPGFMDN